MIEENLEDLRNRATDTQDKPKRMGWRYTGTTNVMTISREEEKLTVNKCKWSCPRTFDKIHVLHDEGDLEPKLILGAKIRKGQIYNFQCNEESF